MEYHLQRERRDGAEAPLEILNVTDVTQAYDYCVACLDAEPDLHAVHLHHGVTHIHTIRRRAA